MTRLTAMFRSSLLRAKLVALTTFALAAAVPAQRTPSLPPGSEVLQVPAGHVATLRVFARGVQVYRCDPVTLQWTFSHPYALLYANAACNSLVGLHTGGPTWMTFSGSTVVGNALAASTVDPTAIPWLLLEARSAQGPGVLANTTFIQRVNTVGGLRPASPGNPGQIVLIPYSAEYVFYRSR